jgi:hypothetical protein
MLLLKKMTVFMLAFSWMSLSYLQAMGEQDGAKGTLKEPVYAELEEGEPIFDGRILDEGTVTDVTQLSFYGNTSVGGIRREDNDSVTKIDLEHTQSLKVTQQAFASKRYPQNDFAEVSKATNDGMVVKGLLVPRHIVICGIEKKSGDKKAWFLGTIDELIVTKSGGPENGGEVEKKKENSEVKTEGPESSEDEKKTVASTKEVYKNEELKIVEKQSVMEQGSIVKSINDLIVAIVNVFKAIWRTIKGVFWSV